MQIYKRWNAQITMIDHQPAQPVTDQTCHTNRSDRLEAEDP